jgi:hypothetical protein
MMLPGREEYVSRAAGQSASDLSVPQQQRTLGE